MKIRINLKNFIFLLAVFYSATLLLPLIEGYFGAIFTMLLTVVMILVLVFARIKDSKYVWTTLVLFSLFFFINSYTRRINYDEWYVILYSVFKQSVAITLPFYFYSFSTRNSNYLEKLFKIVCLIVMITEITSIRALNNYPDYARIAINSISNELTHEINRLNIGAFSYVYFAPFIFIALFCNIHKSFFNKIVCIVYVLLTITFILKAQYTLGLIFFVSSVIFCFASNGKNWKMIVISVASVFGFVKLMNPFGKLLMSFSESFESQNISSRVYDIGTALTGGSVSDESDFELRRIAYQKSFDSFIKHPFWGGGQSGGHSDLLDLLAIRGLVGLFFMALAFVILFELVFRKYNKVSGYFGLSIVLLLVGITLNPLFSASYVFVFSLSLCYTTQQYVFSCKDDALKKSDHGYGF